MAHVQTVLGPIDPAELGWVLPHEHTAIALWHIPNRWDYWELRRDEPVIVEELAAFRAAGGGTLVDLTLDGVGRDPEWLAGIARGDRPAHRHGLRLVSRRPTTRPRRSIDRRSVDALADDHRPRRDGRRRGDRDPAGIIGEIGTDKPWLSAQEERVHRAAARAARRTGLAITTHAVQSTVGLDQLDVFEAEGADLARVVIGHADSNPSLDYHLAIVERGATVEFDFLGMSFTPLERHGEGRIVDLLRELAGAGPRRADPAVAGRLPRQPAPALRRQRLHVPRRHVPARLRAAGVSDDEIRTITVDNPRRLLTIAEPPAPAAAAPPEPQPSRVASTDIATLPLSAREIGQPSLAASAAARKSGGVDARDAADDGEGARHDPPAGLQLVEGHDRGHGQSGRRRARRGASAPDRAIAKQAAWAAARAPRGSSCRRTVRSGRPS